MSLRATIQLVAVKLVKDIVLEIVSSEFAFSILIDEKLLKKQYTGLRKKFLKVNHKVLPKYSVDVKSKFHCFPAKPEPKITKISAEVTLSL